MYNPVYLFIPWVFLLFSMTEIKKVLNDVPTLAKDLYEIRQESFEHSQLVIETI